MGFEQYGGFVSLGYRLSDHWNASAMADITRFNASNPVKVSDDGLVEPISDNDQGIVRGSANLVFENRYERTSGALSVYNNYGNHRIDDGYVAGKAAQTDFFRSRDAVAGVSLYQNFQASSTTSITAGIDYQHIYGRAWYEDKATGAMVTSGQRITMRQSGHAHENEVAAYADVRQEVTKYVTLSAGLRYDHHSAAGGEWIPQAGLVVRPIGTGEFKFMFSKGFRNPTNMELYLYPKANEELRAERMLNYEIGWRQRLTDGRLTYGVNLFLIDGDNMIMTVNRRNINTGEFRNMGVEAEAAWKVNSHWRLSTNHSYLHMDKPIAGAPDYKGYIGADCVYGRFTATAGLQQLVGLHTRFDKENATLLHMTLAYRLCPQVKIWARGENLLAEQYEIEYGYPMPKATFMGGVSLDF